jgi:hypothetical protein
MAKNVMARIIPSFAKPPGTGDTQRYRHCHPLNEMAATAGQGKLQAAPCDCQQFSCALGLHPFVAHSVYSGLSNIGCTIDPAGKGWNLS